MAFNNSKNKEFLNLPEQVEYLSKVVADYPNTEELKKEIDSKLNNSGFSTYNGTLEVRDDFITGGTATASALTLTNSSHQILVGGNYFSFPANGGTLITNASEDNVEFGKDIEVDGNIKVNSPTDIVFKEDNTTLKDKLNSGSSVKLYKHTITMLPSNNPDLDDGSFFFTAYSTKNLEIKSKQDLIMVFGDSSIVGVGKKNVSDYDVSSLLVQITILSSPALVYFWDIKHDQYNQDFSIIRDSVDEII